jgi:hypothetical protein
MGGRFRNGSEFGMNVSTIKPVGLSESTLPISSEIERKLKYRFLKRARLAGKWRCW